jgi:hypothetical protein
LIQIDFIKPHAVKRSETFSTEEGQSTEKWEVTALMVQPGSSAGPSTLAFRSAAGSLSLTGSDSTANSFARLF